jgi:hypothetical protein
VLESIVTAAGFDIEKKQVSFVQTFIIKYSKFSCRLKFAFVSKICKAPCLPKSVGAGEYICGKHLKAYEVVCYEGCV